MTREQIAQQIAAELAGKSVFVKMSVPQVTAILLYGAKKDELGSMASFTDAAMMQRRLG